MSSAWQSQSERSNPLALTTIRWIALKLGREPARVLLYPITLYFLLFAPQQRRASLNYLRRVLREKPTWFDAARHIHSFASTILDRVFLFSGQFDQLDISFPQINLPLQYHQKGKGSLLLGSHLGSFEVLRSYAIKKCPLPLKVLMDQDHNPMIVKILSALNSDMANMVIPLGNPESFLKVKECIENDYAVAILGDRAMNDEKTVECVFFGERVSFPTAPIILAASTNAPVILFFGLYLGGNRYKIYFDLLAEKIELSRENRQHSIQQWVQKYVDKLETTASLAPYNWFNFYDYWHDIDLSRKTD